MDVQHFGACMEHVAGYNRALDMHTLGICNLADDRVVVTKAVDSEKYSRGQYVQNHGWQPTDEHPREGTAPAGSYNNHFWARIGLRMRSLRSLRMQSNSPWVAVHCNELEPSSPMPNTRLHGGSANACNVGTMVELL